MRIAYADPPYPGCARKHYGREEVDHEQLLAGLLAKFPDGWALSSSSSALERLLAITGRLCPGRVRVMAWVKPFAIWKQNVNPTYAWEPLLVCGGRRRVKPQRTVRDWLSANIALRTGTPGAKPGEFCRWLFEVLNLRPEDEFHDLYPGSGAVTRAWAEYRRDFPHESTPQRHETNGDGDSLRGHAAALAGRVDQPQSGQPAHARGRRRSARAGRID